MKTIDERELQKATKEKQTKTERSRGTKSIMKGWELDDYLGFLQLICKGSVIFKSNIELALWITLKQRELYEPKHVSEECRGLRT